MNVVSATTSFKELDLNWMLWPYGLSATYAHHDDEHFIQYTSDTSAGRGSITTAYLQFILCSTKLRGFRTTLSCGNYLAKKCHG